MLSTMWCYKLDQTQEAYSVFEVAIPISQKQATYILKKRLQIKNVFDIIACSEIKKRKI